MHATIPGILHLNVIGDVDLVKIDQFKLKKTKAGNTDLFFSKRITGNHLLTKTLVSYLTPNSLKGIFLWRKYNEKCFEHG